MTVPPCGCDSEMLPLSVATTLLPRGLSQLLSGSAGRLGKQLFLRVHTMSEYQVGLKLSPVSLKKPFLKKKKTNFCNSF